MTSDVKLITTPGRKGRRGKAGRAPTAAGAGARREPVPLAEIEKLAEASDDPVVKMAPKLRAALDRYLDAAVQRRERGAAVLAGVEETGRTIRNQMFRWSETIGDPPDFEKAHAMLSDLRDVIREEEVAARLKADDEHNELLLEELAADDAIFGIEREIIGLRPTSMLGALIQLAIAWEEGDPEPQESMAPRAIYNAALLIEAETGVDRYDLFRDRYLTGPHRTRENAPLMYE